MHTADRAADSNAPTPPLTRRSYLLAGAAAAATACTVGAGWQRAAASSTPPTTAAGDSSPAGAESAEAAVEAYLAALAAGDFDAALATFAIDSYVDGFDFRRHLEWMRFYQPHQSMPLPPSNPFNRALDIEFRRGRVSAQVLSQYFMLAHPSFGIGVIGRSFPDDDELDAFVAELEQMTPEVLSEVGEHAFITLEEIDADAVATLSLPEAVEQDDIQLALIGADEAAELAVSTSVSGAALTMLFRVLRYDDGWWIESLGGRFALVLGLSSDQAGVIRDVESVASGSEPDGTDP